MKKGIAPLLLGLVAGIGLVAVALIAIFWPRCESSLWLAAVYHNINTSEVSAWFEGSCLNIPAGDVLLNITSRITNETVFITNEYFAGTNKNGYFLIPFNATGLEENKQYKLEATFSDWTHVSRTFFAGDMPSIDE